MMKNLNRIVSVFVMFLISFLLIGSGLDAQNIKKPGRNASKVEIAKYYGSSTLKGANLADLPASLCSTDAPVDVYVNEDRLLGTTTNVVWTVYTGAIVTGNYVEHNDWVTPIGTAPNNGISLNPAVILEYGTNIKIAYEQVGSDGSEDNLDVTVVNKTPNAINFTQIASICDGDVASITLPNAEVGTYYNLYNGAILITDEGASKGEGVDINFFVVDPGVYIVKAFDSNTEAASTCFTWMTGAADVTVHTRPTPGVGGDNDVCVGDAGITYATEAGMTGYMWTVSAGGTITAGDGTEEITVMWNTAGAQNVSVDYTNANGCNANTPTVYGVTVNSLPTPTVSGDNDVCVGDVGVVYSTQATMNNYVWTISAGGTITAGAGTDEITVTWNTVGAQTVSVNYDNVNTCGAATPTTFNVNVNTLPTPTITGANVVCESDMGITYSTELGMGSYVWNVSAGGTITGGGGTEEITVTWNGSGAQTVSVNYDNVTGCDASAATVYNVTVNTLPNPSVAGDNDVCQGDAGYTYSTEPGMTNYVWNISAGGLITGGAGTNEVTVSWNTAGAQSVSVNYDNVSGCDALLPTSYNVNVNAAPVPTVSGNNVVCEGDAGITYSTQGAMASYIWTVSAGGTITAGDATNEITVTWNTAGAQSVSVNYDNASGCDALTPTTFNVTVNALPSPSVTGVNSVCESVTGVLYSTEPGMAGYTWAVSAGGTITGGAGTEEITVTWNTAGAQNVSVNYDNATGCDALNSTVYNVTVNSLPTPTVIGNAIVCEGDIDVVYTTEAAMTNYVWNVSAGGVITGGDGTDEITVTWNTAGAQTVSVNYDNAAGCDALLSTVSNITVNTIPVPVIIGDANVCQGDAGLIYSTQAGMNNYVWVISAGGIITSGDGTDEITVTWNTAGPQTVSVNYDNLAGCNALIATEFAVAVNQVTATLNITNPSPPGTSVCAATTVTFLGSGADGSGNYNYEFFVAGVSQGVANATPSRDITINNDVLVEIEVTDNVTGCVDRTSINMTVKAIPTVNLIQPSNGDEFCEGESITLTSAPAGYANYVYYKTDGTTDTQLNTLGTEAYDVATGFDPTITGVYVVTTNNGCSAQSATINISVNSLPTANAGTDQTICEGDALVLDGSAAVGTPGYTYNWVGPNGYVANATEDPDLGTADLNEEGTYILTVVDAKLCEATDDVVINLDELPVDQTVVAENADYCEASTGVRIYLQNSEAGIRYQLQDATNAQIGVDVVADGIATVEWTNVVAGSYHVVAFGGTANACSIRMTTADIVIAENALPNIYNITPSDIDLGCNGGAGWPIGISGSDNGIEYQLLRNGTAYGAAIDGNGGAITLDANVTAFGVYTIMATNKATLCNVVMSGDYEIQSDVVVTTYDMTSDPVTGDYCASDADPGVVLGMTGSDATVDYQLILNGNAAAPEQSKIGDGNAISFDTKVTIDGVYTVQVETPGGCSYSMNGSVNITKFDDPTVFNLRADNNGFYCPDAGGAPTGVNIWLVGQQNGIEYSLYRANGGTPLLVEMITGTVDDPLALLNFTAGPFTTEDSYYVEAQRPGVGCNSTMNNTIVVAENPLLNAYNVSKADDFCAGSSVSLFIDGSENDAEYRWVANDGTADFDNSAWIAGTGTAIEFAGINVAGTYRVEARRLENGITCTREMLNTIDVFEKPLPLDKVWSTTGGTGCDDGVVITIENSEAGVTYYLYKRGAPDTEVTGSEIVGDGNDISFAPISDNAANYNVIAELNGCSNNFDVNIPVNVVGAINKLTVDGGGSVCDGGVVGAVIGMTENTVVGVTYELFLVGTPDVKKAEVVGDGNVRNFGNQTDLGEYYVMGTNSADASCPTEMTNRVSISFFPSPTADITSDIGNTICLGTEVTFTASGGDNYQFYLNGNPLGIMSAVNTYITSGLIPSDRVSVMAQSADGCTDLSAEIIMVVNPMPTGKTVGTTGSFCQGTASNVSVYVENPEAGFTYNLINDADDSTVGTDNTLPILFANIPVGTYRVEASASGCSVVMNNTVTVAATPLPTIFNIIPTGTVTSCVDNTIKIENSELNVAYTLIRTEGGVTNIVGGPTDGTHNGVEITFGDYKVSGTYSVRAENIVTGCQENMGGTFEIVAGTGTAFDVLPMNGNYCAGTTRPEISINSSVQNIKYILYRNDGAGNVVIVEITSAADGEVINFGALAQDGTYFVVGEDGGGCQFAMNNSVVLQSIATPTAFPLETQNGLAREEYCPGDVGVAAIHVKGQQLGVVYSLYDSGDNIIGAAQTGVVDDSNVDIVFAGPFAAEEYHVVAVNVTGCPLAMNNTVVVAESPAIRDDFEVNTSGDICTGGFATITTNGSENNVRYWLFRNGLTTGNFIDGNGGVLDPPFNVNQGGTYTLEAENAAGCKITLTDNAIISETNLPVAKEIVSDGGVDCSVGAIITVRLADPNVVYRLYKRTGGGDILVDGSDITHTSGAPMDLKFVAIADNDAYYTVKASNGSCEVDMSNDPGVDDVDDNNDDVYIDIPESALKYEVTPDNADICNGDLGQTFSLVNSEESVVYSLYLADAVGSVTGELKSTITGPVGGGAINFAGTYNEPGEYFVLAVKGACTTAMVNRPTLNVNPLPTAFKLIGSGFYCDVATGAEIELENQEADVRYNLQFQDGMEEGSVLGGTAGDTISFGRYTKEGVYRVVAYNELTTCTSNMEGEVLVAIAATPIDQVIASDNDTMYCGATVGVQIRLTDNELDVTYQVREVGSASKIISEVVGTNATGGPVELVFPDLIPVGTYEIWKTRGGDACETITNGGETIQIYHENEPTSHNVLVDDTNVCGSTGAVISLEDFEPGRSYRIEDTTGPIADSDTISTAPFEWNVTEPGGTSEIYEIYAIAGTDCDKSMGTIEVMFNESPNEFVTFTQLGDDGATKGSLKYCEGDVGLKVGIENTQLQVAYMLYDTLEYFNAVDKSLVSPVDVIIGNGSQQMYTKDLKVGGYTVKALLYTTGCELWDNDTVEVFETVLPVITYDVYCNTIGNTDCTVGDSICLEPSEVDVQYILYKDGVETASLISGDGNKICFKPIDNDSEYTIVAKSVVEPFCQTQFVTGMKFSYANFGHITAVDDNFNIKTSLLADTINVRVNDTIVYVHESLPRPIKYGEFDPNTPGYFVVDRYLEDYIYLGETEAKDTSNIRFSLLKINDDGSSVESPSIMKDIVGELKIDEFTGRLAYVKTPGFFGVDSLRYVMKNTEFPLTRVDTATVYLYVGNKEINENMSFLIPNAFSPNGDDINDYFIISGKEGGVPASKSGLEVFNRWGNLVYRSKGVTYGDDDEWWDGTSSTASMVSIGSELPNGTYYYVFKVEVNIEGEVKTNEYNGYIELRR